MLGQAEFSRPHVPSDAQSLSGTQPRPAQVSQPQQSHPANVVSTEGKTSEDDDAMSDFSVSTEYIAMFEPGSVGNNPHSGRGQLTSTLYELHRS